MRSNIQAMNNIYISNAFLSELDSMCRSVVVPEPVIQESIKVLDFKFERLIYSGATAIAEPSTERTDLEGIRARVKRLHRMFKQIESMPIVDYGCRPSTYGSADLDMCFKLTRVLSEGALEFRVDALAREKGKGMFATFIVLEKEPEICSNGAPRFRITRVLSSQAEKISNTVDATCEYFESSYSKTHPTKKLIYK